jgi:hypothetical protein
MNRSDRSGLLMTALVGIVLLGCIRVSGGPRVVGSGVSQTETRQVGVFHNVRIDGAAKVNIKIGDEPALTVTADDNILPIITTDVRGDTLVISCEDNVSYSPKVGVTVEITTPALSAVEINGSGDVNVTDLKAQKFSAIIRGSGDVRATGSADTINAEIKGSGDIKLGELQAKSGSVSVAGSGNATVNVSDQLNVSVAGSGDIRYKGSPKIQKSIAGSGSVKPVG